MAFGKANYRVRAHNGGRSWADHRARLAVQERADQAAALDEGLCRGAPDRPMASALEGAGGVRALVVGGCCELNTAAHELLADFGSQAGAYNAAESGESLTECIALEINRVRQRLAIPPDMARLPRSHQRPHQVRRPGRGRQTKTRRGGTGKRRGAGTGCKASLQ